jgi:hypothetical protein
VDYQRIYEKLIAYRKENPLRREECYCERHHYVPRCLGGTNESWNLVNLTAKEHFIAHHLLCKIMPDEGKLLNAFIVMRAGKDKNRKLYISAKRYEILKTRYGKFRKEMFAQMTEEEREERREKIKEGCANRSESRRKRKVERWRESYAKRSEADKEKTLERRRKTLESRSLEKKQEITERISRAHRKLSEELELRIIHEYKQGKTALVISQQSWCTLSREGVNYLLRRRGVKTHTAPRWDGKEASICDDYKSNKYPTRSALAKAYGTSWDVIVRILEKNSIVVEVNPRRRIASRKREFEKIANERVSYYLPFSYNAVEDITLAEAIRKLRFLGVIPKSETERIVKKKIRNAIRGDTKFAYGFKWKSAEG